MVSAHIYILFPLLMFLHLVAPKLRTGSPLLHHAATLHLHYQFRHVPCFYATLGFVYVGWYGPGALMQLVHISPLALIWIYTFCICMLYFLSEQLCSEVLHIWHSRFESLYSLALLWFLLISWLHLHVWVHIPTWLHANARDTHMRYSHSVL